jgi:hypothetical protein
VAQKMAQACSKQYVLQEMARATAGSGPLREPLLQKSHGPKRLLQDPDMMSWQQTAQLAENFYPPSTFEFTHNGAVFVGIHF